MAKDFDTMEDSNRSANPSIHEVSDPQRRTLLLGGAAALAGVLSGCGAVDRFVDRIVDRHPGLQRGPRLGFQGIPAGVGDALVKRLIEDGRTAGYRVMRLDTSMHQPEAMALYEKAGFRRIAPYYDVPEDLRDWLRYYEMKL